MMGRTRQQMWSKESLLPVKTVVVDLLRNFAVLLDTVQSGDSFEGGGGAVSRRILRRIEPGDTPSSADGPVSRAVKVNCDACAAAVLRTMMVEQAILGASIDQKSSPTTTPPPVSLTLFSDDMSHALLIVLGTETQLMLEQRRTELAVEEWEKNEMAMVPVGVVLVPPPGDTSGGENLHPEAERAGSGGAPSLSEGTIGGAEGEHSSRAGAGVVDSEDEEDVEKGGADAALGAAVLSVAGGILVAGFLVMAIVMGCVIENRWVYNVEAELKQLPVKKHGGEVLRHAAKFVVKRACGKEEAENLGFLVGPTGGFSVLNFLQPVPVKKHVILSKLEKVMLEGEGGAGAVGGGKTGTSNTQELIDALQQAIADTTPPASTTVGAPAPPATIGAGPAGPPAGPAPVGSPVKVGSANKGQGKGGGPPLSTTESASVVETGRQIPDRMIAKDEEYPRQKHGNLRATKPSWLQLQRKLDRAKDDADVVSALAEGDLDAEDIDAIAEQFLGADEDAGERGETVGTEILQRDVDGVPLGSSSSSTGLLAEHSFLESVRGAVSAAPRTLSRKESAAKERTPPGTVSQEATSFLETAAADPVVPELSRLWPTASGLVSSAPADAGIANLPPPDDHSLTKAPRQKYCLLKLKAGPTISVVAALLTLKEPAGTAPRVVRNAADRSGSVDAHLISGKFPGLHDYLMFVAASNLLLTLMQDPASVLKRAALDLVDTDVGGVEDHLRWSVGNRTENLEYLLRETDELRRQWGQQ